MATLYFLRKKTKELGITWDAVHDAIGNVSAISILVAVLITIANFFLLTGYDLIAVRYLKKDLPIRRVMMGAVIGYALSNILGWLVGGNAVRYRLYTRWGFSLVEFVGFITILSVTFWLGLFLLAGLSFVSLPVRIPPRIQEDFLLIRCGWMVAARIGGRLFVRHSRCSEAFSMERESHLAATAAIIVDAGRCLGG